MSAFRIKSGGRVDRSKPLRFTFDGQAFMGLQGDTLASALLANGVHLSLKNPDFLSKLIDSLNHPSLETDEGDEEHIEA